MTEKASFNVFSTENLIHKSIANDEELNEFEQQNMEQALEWIMNHRYTAEQVFTLPFICKLHKRMFGKVWTNAGNLRQSNKKVGIEPSKIPFAIKVVLDDALFWIKTQKYPSSEIAIRFKHQLAVIQCFEQGNGRHSRMMADLINEKLLIQPQFTWGKSYSKKQAQINYLTAIEAADHGDILKMIDFAFQ